MASARAAKFADALAPCAQDGHVIEVRRNGAVDAIAGIEPLVWDSRHFGVSCARLAPLCVSPELSSHTRFAAV
ncbi:MAG TPA: hypothetical protein VHA77_09915, partial [Xanthobacteraceae bacterium]|nr:hypothetical protein [Xanthobacteraceae bacterium]